MNEVEKHGKKILGGILLVACLIIGFGQIRDSRESEAKQKESNSEIQQESSRPLFDVRLNGSNKTLLKEYYQGDITSSRVVLFIRGNVPTRARLSSWFKSTYFQEPMAQDYMDSTFEWTKSTGRGTWKAEYHSVQDPGIRKSGKLQVTLDQITQNYCLILYDENGNVHETGTIILISN